MKVPSSVIETSKNIYTHSYKYILIVWSIYALFELIQSNYFQCIKEYQSIFYILKLILIIIFGLFIIQILFHILIFQNNDKAMIDFENTEPVTKIGGGKIKHMIIPIYALLIFSFSKMILIVISNKMYDFPFFSSVEVDYIWMWFLVFLASLIFWFNHKKKAEKKWDFKLTIVVIFITSVQLFWSSFYLPITKSVLNITECIGNEIVKEKIIEGKRNIN